MKLWVMTNEYTPFIIGGLGVVATNLTAALAKHSSEIIILAKTGHRHMEIQKEPNIKILRFPRHSEYYSVPKQKFFYTPIANCLKKKGYGLPDLIHIHSVEFTGVAGYYKRKYNIPIVYTCHSLVSLERRSAKRELVAKRQQKLLDLCDHIVVPSQWELEQLEDKYEFCRGKVTVIKNGVQLLDTAHITARKRNRLLFVGRLIRSKGIEELLHALALLSLKKRTTTLDVVGTGSFTYMKYLKALAAKLDVSRQVHWLGYIEPEKVQKLYNSYGAVVVPSRRESFGLVALEALAHGVPLVSTSSGGLADFVNEDVAEVIPKVQSSRIVTAVKRMWKEEEITRLRVEEGLKMAMNYEWAEISMSYQQLFSQMIPVSEVE